MTHPYAIFDREFFPTPPALVYKLAARYLDDSSIESVLDPSAGKGDLLAPFRRRGHKDVKLYAFERNADLQAMLRAERPNECSVTVLGADFLAYTGRHRFDLIVMNPPFSAAAAHVWKALGLLQAGSHLALILPTTFFKSEESRHVAAYARLRALGAEIMPVGSAFAASERRTQVEVAIVHVRLPQDNTTTFDFRAARVVTDTVPQADSPLDIENQIATRDYITNATNGFRAATQALVDLSAAWQRARAYLANASVDIDRLLPLEFRAKAKPESINSLIDVAQEEAWHQLINSTKIERLFTERMRKDFSAYIANQAKLDFNIENIRAFFALVIDSRKSILEQCVLDVFEKMCSYDKRNKIHWEGWKTNDAYKVNRKVILPWLIRYEKSFGFSFSYSGDYAAVDDIDKAMCHVIGRSYDESLLTIRRALSAFFQQSKLAKSLNPRTESEFFYIRAYKKGTLHLEFKDAAVWERFNILAARGRGWLGEVDAA